MPAEALLPAAFVVAALVTFLAAPLAIRVAFATGFLDHPSSGYKAHAGATPYLGGAAIAAGVLVSALAFGGATDDFTIIVVGALALWALGTVDDRINLSPLLRVVVETIVGLALWRSGQGWEVFGSSVPDAAFTVLWVVGIVNAFNLMDNMNGAAAATAGVSAFGAAGLALATGQTTLAALCLAVVGACAGFLPYNLARPSRIFMGDGGSMLLGTLVASIAIGATPVRELHVNAIVPAALLAGLAILDTTLVCFSRSRGGRPLLSGGRDHLTHRLASRLGSPDRVAFALAGAQTALCAVAVVCSQLGTSWVLTVGLLAVGVGAGAVAWLDSPAWFVAPPAPAQHDAAGRDRDRTWDHAAAVRAPGE